MHVHEIITNGTMKTMCRIIMMITPDPGSEPPSNKNNHADKGHNKCCDTQNKLEK